MTEHQPIAFTTSLTIIMPAHNAARTLARCVEAVRASVPFGSELIIIDDGSLDDTRRIAASIADRLVVLPCQSGAARARNEGIRVAVGNVILFVDSDVVVNGPAVAGLLEAIADGADAVFGAYTPLPPQEARSLATDYKNHVHHVTHVVGGRRFATTFWSGFSAIRKDVFDAVGGFDPGVTRSADVEDIHLGYRLTAAGYRIAVEPTCQVEHLKRYTTRGLFASDLFHRAIPWTRAVLEIKTFRADMNLAGPSLIGVGMFGLGLVVATTSPWTNGVIALPVAASLVLGWLWTQRRLVASCWRVGGARLGIAAIGYGAAFCIYSPLGALLGVGAHLLRPRSASVRNTAPLAVSTDDSVAVPLTIGIITMPTDDRQQVEDLVRSIPPNPRYEVLIVRSVSEPTASTILDSPARTNDALTDTVRVVEALPGDPPRTRCQRALEAASTPAIVLLEPGMIVSATWFERALAAAERGFLVTGGSFRLTDTSVRHRAAATAWFGPWLSEVRERWMEDHPAMNSVFDCAVLRRVGGFSERASTYRRLSVFGARVVHFDPTMQVELPESFRCRPMRQKFGLSRAQSASMVAYYDNGRALRVCRMATTAATVPVSVARRIRTAQTHKVADAMFWRTLPRVAMWSVVEAAGSIAGYADIRAATPNALALATPTNPLATSMTDAAS